MAKVRDKGLIAKKIGMTRVASDAGDMIPITLLQVADQCVTKVMDGNKDGYYGYQVGYFVKASKNLSKADLGRLKKAEVEKNYAKFTEFRTHNLCDLKLGQALTAQDFEGIENVDITGFSKGRGFQGSVKRWGTAIGRMTHGSRFHRRPGSLGQCTSPGRVFKNKKQPGHMGVERKTIKNLEVVKIDLDNNLIAIRGSVPGARQGFVEIRSTGK